MKEFIAQRKSIAVAVVCAVPTAYELGVSARLWPPISIEPCLGSSVDDLLAEATGLVGLLTGSKRDQILPWERMDIMRRHAGRLFCSLLLSGAFVLGAAPGVSARPGRRWGGGGRPMAG